MRAIVIPTTGGPEVLEVRERPDPDPEYGQVRVAVEACGFNFAEMMARQGMYPDAPDLPAVMGYEAAGVVDEVGEGVSGFEPGDHVVVVVQFGAHADTLVADEEQVFPMPDGMSFEEAAAIPVNYITAYHMLFKVASLDPGQSVLVHMAAGGVGTAVLQLCGTVEDVTVYGTASPGKHEMVQKHGCDYPIDYRTKDYVEEVRRLTGGEGVDVVLDPLGGKDWQKGYDLLKPVGHLVAFGFANMASGETVSWWNVLRQYFSVPKWSPMTLMDENKSIGGVNIGHLWDRVEMLRGEVDALLEFYENGDIQPRIDSTFPFEDAAEAHRRMHNRQNVGKIILTPD